MASQLATVQQQAAEWTPQDIEVIRQTIVPGATREELALFAKVCQRTGLDPFSKQIYAIKRGGRMTIQAGIDGLRSIAERTGQFAGCQRYWCGPDGQWQEVWLGSKPPAAAKCVVWRRGCEHPFVGIATLAEYDAKQGLWQKMPSTMLAKCAEAQALRTGFPADLSGIYSTEEMQQADVREVPAQAAPVPAALPAKAGPSEAYAKAAKAITAAATTERLAEIGIRIDEHPDLSDQDREQLLVMLQERHAQLQPAAGDADPFGTDGNG